MQFWCNFSSGQPSQEGRSVCSWEVEVSFTSLFNSYCRITKPRCSFLPFLVSFESWTLVPFSIVPCTWNGGHRYMWVTHRWGMRLCSSLSVTFHFCSFQTVKECFWRQDSSETCPLSASHDQPQGPAVSVSLCLRKAGYPGNMWDGWKNAWKKA